MVRLFTAAFLTVERSRKVVFGYTVPNRSEGFILHTVIKAGEGLPVLCRGFVVVLGGLRVLGFGLNFQKKHLKEVNAVSSLSRLAPEVPALFPGNPLLGQIIGGRQEVGGDSLDPAPTSFSC